MKVPQIAVTIVIAACIAFATNGIAAAGPAKPVKPCANAHQTASLVKRAERFEAHAVTFHEKSVAKLMSGTPAPARAMENASKRAADHAAELRRQAAAPATPCQPRTDTGPD